MNYGEIYRLPIFYDPFSNFGSINQFPLGTIEYYIMDLLFLIIPSYFLGLYGATKFFVVLSCIILGLSFFKFTKIFSENTNGRILGTIFFLFNPFMLQIYTNGDFQAIIFQSLFFIGTIFFDLAILSKKYLNTYYLIAAFLLVLSYQFFDLVIIGTLFYLIIFFYDMLFKVKSKRFPEKIKFTLISLLAFLSTLVSMSTLFVLPVIYGSNSYLPGSLSSLTLNSFLGGAIPLFNVLTMKAYPPYLGWSLVGSFYGPLLFVVWNFLEIFLVLFILISYLFFKDKRLLYLTGLAILFVLIASESAGPFASLTIFLFEKFPAYQALNYPYLWEWLIISPIYCVLLVIITSNIYDTNRTEKLRNWINNVSRCKRVVRRGGRKVLKTLNFRRFTKIGVPILVLLIIIPPISTQGYYGPNGIKSVPMPVWMNTLDHTLINLTEKNNTGVIFNTINEYFNFKNDTSNGLGNLLQYYPQYKTISLSSYIPNYNTETNFFYWFYHLFYTNGTKYSAQILSTVGVQYFVDIYNANSEGYPSFVPWSHGINASSILKNQVGWSLIKSTSNYSIFKNDVFVSNSYYTNNLSILLGDYNTLNYLSYLGANLSTITPLFANDLHTMNYSLLFNHTNLIVLNGYNSLLDLVLGLSNSNAIYPAKFVNGQVSDPGKSWINSERLNNYPQDSSVIPFAETSGFNKLTIPVKVTQAGYYNIYLKVLFSNENIQSTSPSKLKIIENNLSSVTLNTTHPYNGEINNFLWVKSQVRLNAGRNYLTLQSQSGMNAVSEAYIISNYSLEKALNKTDSLLQKNKGNIVEVFPSSHLSLENSSKYVLGNLGNSLFPDGNYIQSSLNTVGNELILKSPILYTGKLIMELKTIGDFSLNLSYNRENTRTTLFSNQNNSISNPSSGWISYPISNLSEATVTLSNNQGDIGFLAMIPNDFSPDYKLLTNSGLGNLTSNIVAPGISNFSHKMGRISGHQFVSGSFNYASINTHFPIILSFSGKYQYNFSALFNANINGPSNLSVNGLLITSNTNFTGVVSPSLNFQYNGKPKNITIEFSPWYFNNSNSYHVNFNVSFYGFLKVSPFVLDYSSLNGKGPVINYSISSTNLYYKSNKLLVIRGPYLTFDSSMQVFGISGGLNYILYGTKEGNVSLEYPSFEYFTFGLDIAITYVAFYTSIIFLSSIRKKRIVNRS